MIGNTQLHAELGKIPAPVCQLRKLHDTDTGKEKKNFATAKRNG